MNNIPPKSSYLAAESGGDQGGHDDNGDHNLDGVSCSHLECFFSKVQNVCRGPVPGNRSLRNTSTSVEPLRGNVFV
jgi:hypothetical protein